AEQAAPAISGISPDLLGRSRGEGTAAFRVDAGGVEAAVAELIAGGRSAAEPAALIVNPGGPGQRKVLAPLDRLPETAAGLPGGLVRGVGPGVAGAGRLDSLAGRPLPGRRVLVTRARPQAGELPGILADL